MPSIQIRPFQRADREQLTALVNAHVGAVVPGVSVSVNTLLSQLEREPDESIVDPWVVERRTLVASSATPSSAARTCCATAATSACRGTTATAPRSAGSS